MALPFLFRRPLLASTLADKVLGLDPFSDGSGTFLAAPRRTGKSTFLKADLVPELRHRGVLAIYVDLWADRNRDPADILVEAIRHATSQSGSGVTKVARRAGLSKIGVPGIATIDVKTEDQKTGSIPSMLRDLIETSGKPVVLIVDEAQHATMSEAGRNAMFALKSARDQMNLGYEGSATSNVRLGLVLTGSNLDRLATLVIGKSQPFFGSRVTRFPLLDRAYTNALASILNAQLKADSAVDPEMLWTAFEMVSYRPQLLMHAISEAIASETISSEGLIDIAKASRDEFWKEFEDQHAALTPLQQNVLGELIDNSSQFRPFSSAALERYQRELGSPVVASDVQSALDALREKNIVVKLGRGAYTLDDATIVEWYRARQSIEDTTPSLPGPR